MALHRRWHLRVPPDRLGAGNHKGNLSVHCVGDHAAVLPDELRELPLARVKSSGGQREDEAAEDFGRGRRRAAPRRDVLTVCSERFGCVRRVACRSAFDLHRGVLVWHGALGCTSFEGHAARLDRAEDSGRARCPWPRGLGRETVGDLESVRIVRPSAFRVCVRVRVRVVPRLASPGWVNGSMERGLRALRTLLPSSCRAWPCVKRERARPLPWRVLDG